ncbi:ankyrin repeat domain-containing protein 7 [Odocoileus virginianus]|uniref:Ankyrin repeat domain-containing protein 7 n=1 Tax=Odocoileus virginianus TaxID=9874 RepID=A0ABM4IWX8_ODOVR
MYSEALHTGFAEYMWPLKKKEVKDDCKTFDLSSMKNGITCPYALSLTCASLCRYRTPLHLACANGYSNTVSLLTEKQCKVNVWDGENRSPLTKDGYTPLLLAIAENNAEMVEFLLKSEADVNASDKNQRTALMIALSDEPSLVSLLLQQEVDLSCQDIYGFTAEEYASFNGFTIYHQLIANNEKEKKVKQISNSTNNFGHDIRYRRTGGREHQAAMAQERLRGATPPPRSGAAAERTYQMPEARGGGQEELTHVQGALVAWAQGGREELLHVQGQEGHSRGDTPGLS